MKIKSSGDAARPLRQIPLQFSHFATKGEIRRESPGGCGRFTPQEFREQRFHHRSRKLSLLSGRIDNGASSIRHESTRSERKTRPSGHHPMIFAPNGAYSKQRDETEAYGKSLITVACCLCNTSPKRLPQSWLKPLVSVVRSTQLDTTGIPTGRPAYSAATLPCGMAATRPTSPLPTVRFALTMFLARLRVRISAVTRTSTLPSSASSPAGLRSRT